MKNEVQVYEGEIVDMGMQGKEFGFIVPVGLDNLSFAFAIYVAAYFP